MKCPLKSCDKPFENHNGIEKIVHAEKAEKQNAVGSNGGFLCDVTRGPCSCGAWH